MRDMEAVTRYPVQVEVDYPSQQSRGKALLRLPFSIPVLLCSALLQGGAALTIRAAILVRGRIPPGCSSSRWRRIVGSFGRSSQATALGTGSALLHR